MKMILAVACLLFVSSVRSECDDARRRLDALDQRLGNQRVTYCSIGLKNGVIRDNQLSVSSFWPRYKAPQGRLDKVPRHDNSGGVWAPAPAQRTAGQWFQVDLLTPTRVFGVVTQGRSNLNEWITGYKILYGNSTDNLQTYRSGHNNYDTIFPGNFDRNSYVINDFNPSIVARYLRLVVFSYSRAVSLRMDYLIC